MNKKYLLQLFCLTALFFLVRAVLLYLIEPAEYSIFFNQILKNKAAGNNGRIDMVILGTSRPHRTFDPSVFEQELGLDSVFNASSGLQPIEASYYMLKDIHQRYKPRYAVLDITDITLFSRSASLEKMIVLDRLHGSNKAAYLLNGFSQDEYLNAVSLCYRFRNNFTPEKIREIVGTKRELRANGYQEMRSDPDLYTKDGFIYSFLRGDIDNTLTTTSDFSIVIPEKLEYLEKITAFCEANDIQLFLVTAPWSMMFMYECENYADFIDYVSAYASEHHLSYINLNFLRGREEWLGDDVMFDAGHVNGEGAERVSRQYAQVLKALINGEELPDIFYGSISEVKAEAHRILGVGAKISIIGGIASVHITSRQTDEIRPLYRVMISSDDEKFSPLTDWTEETDLDFPMSGYRGTVHFLIEAMSPDGGPECSVKYHVPV